MGTVATLITFDQFEQLPDRPGKRELLRGELIELPPADQDHNDISRAIFLALYAAVEQLRRDQPDLSLGEVYFETGYQLSVRSWLQPDVSLTHPGQVREKYYQGAPLLAIEVVSESNTAESIQAKIQEYLTCGGREVWAVYRKTKMVWVYREGGATPYETTLQTGLLPAFSLDLASIFEAA